MPNSEEINTREEENDLDLPEQPEEESRVYGVLKCYFHTPKRGDIWGAFSLLFNGATGESMDNVFWVTRLLTGQPINVSEPWKALNKLIPKMGNYEKSLGEKLSASLLETFKPAMRIDLCQTDDPSNLLHDVSEEIRNGFERATHCFLDFKMELERMSARELADAGVVTKDRAPAEPETDKTKAEEKALSGALINCVPVIDPVNGKPVSELKPGDMIEVKIQGGVGAGDMIHKYLSSTNQDAVFPIEKIEKGEKNASEKTYIFLDINEELKGLITVTKDIRLRVFKIGAQNKTSITINFDNVIFFGVLAVAVLVIAIVVKTLLF
jgi:hypothetical protein